MKAVIDTSVFTDLTLKVGQKNIAAKAALGNYSELIVLEYMLKEFKNGPLNNFLWFYKKLRETRSLDETLGLLQRISGTPATYRTSTAIEAYKTANAMINKIGLRAILNSSTDTEDIVLADFLAVELKRVILKAWNGRRSWGTLQGKLPCYENKDIEAKNDGLSLDPLKCGKGSKCCVHAEMTKDIEKLKLIRQGIDGCADKTETTRRRAVVKKMISHRNEAIDAKECRAIGDAYFVFAAPKGSCVLTTNRSDLDALGNATGVTICNP